MRQHECNEQLLSNSIVTSHAHHNTIVAIFDLSDCQFSSVHFI